MLPTFAKIALSAAALVAVVNAGKAPAGHKFRAPGPNDGICAIEDCHGMNEC